MSGRTPEELQAEVEQQREQLAGTIDALSAKLDVKAQAQAKVAEVKGTARNRPELVAAAGVLLVAAVAVIWWRKR
jgi:hypothetical protein